MTEFEEFAASQITHIVPEFDKLEVRANISESSYSIEFFTTINGKRMQCFEMIDHNMIKERDFDAAAKAIAFFARSSADFKKGEVNKFDFVLRKE